MIPTPISRIPVAVLGATGAVGQKFLALLVDHPWFEVAAVAASERSVGMRYGDRVQWREPTSLPAAIAALTIQPAAPPLPAGIVFSALDADIAGSIEQAFAAAGAIVVSNARNHRMDPDIPLIVPEINADHLDLLSRQRANRPWSGAIVANPNCSTAGLALVLGCLHRRWPVDRVFVSTMQAVSGAGYPGVPSLDILDNVIPYIAGEEEKIERETRKILGRLVDGQVHAPELTLSAHANRVPVLDGHTEAVSIGFTEPPGVDAVHEALSDFPDQWGVAELPSSPNPPIVVDPRPDRPQPRLDRTQGQGMSVTVGRIRPCPLLDIRLTLVVHNTVRGAAGLAIQDAELLVARGLIP